MKPKHFSPAQCAAGRALAGCSAQGLANKAGVSLAAVTAYEAGQRVAEAAYLALCRALWGRLYLRPIPETDAAGEGVRFRKTAAARRLARQARAMADVIDPAMRAALARRGNAA